MKYGVNTLVWTTHVTEAHEALFARVREWGFDGVELFLSIDEPADISSVRRLLDSLGLERTTCAVLPREDKRRRRGAGAGHRVPSTLCRKDGRIGGPAGVRAPLRESRGYDRRPAYG